MSEIIFGTKDKLQNEIISLKSKIIVDYLKGYGILGVALVITVIGLGSEFLMIFSAEALNLSTAIPVGVAILVFDGWCIIEVIHLWGKIKSKKISLENLKLELDNLIDQEKRIIFDNFLLFLAYFEDDKSFNFEILRNSGVKEHLPEYLKPMITSEDYFNEFLQKKKSCLNYDSDQDVYYLNQLLKGEILSRAFSKSKETRSELIHAAMAGGFRTELNSS